MTDRKTAIATRPRLLTLSVLVVAGLATTGCQTEDAGASATPADGVSSPEPTVEATWVTEDPIVPATDDPTTLPEVQARKAAPKRDRDAEEPVIGDAERADSWWTPTNPTSWQYAIGDSRLNTTVDAAIYTTDGDGTTAAQVRTLHAAGRHVVCYVDAGTWEDWRADAARFPASVKGKNMDDWPGEKWLDIRQSDVLLPLIKARVKTCADKGFDAVEFDNVDGYANKTGFPLTAADQLSYNRALADVAHSYGLSAGLKNDIDQVKALEPSFDFAVNESCLEYRECSAYSPFVKAGKVVLHVEYRDAADFCADRTIAGFTSIAKHENVDAWREACS